MLVTGENAYVGVLGACAPGYSYAVDQGYEAEVKDGATGITIVKETITVDGEEVTAYKVSATAASTDPYTIVFTSTANPYVTCELKVYAFNSASEVPTDYTEQVEAAIQGEWTHTYQVEGETGVQTLKFENGILYVNNNQIGGYGAPEYDELNYSIEFMPDGETYKITISSDDPYFWAMHGIDPNYVNPNDCYVKWNGTEITELKFSFDYVVGFEEAFGGVDPVFDIDGGYHTEAFTKQ